MSKAQRREQRISFAYGNVHLHNPNVTRDMVAAECDKLDFPLDLHPDGTDTLFCKECESRFPDGERGCHKGDACPDCVENSLL